MVTDVLLKRLVEQKLENEPFAYYVLAACDGDQSLSEYIDDGVTPARAATIAAAAVTGQLHRAHLKSVKVRGFRGIGPERTLDLHPANGLTVITGRNGSGKSSFAEAIEVVLTGRCARIDGLQKRWRNGWRNLDQSYAPLIALEFAIEKTGIVTLQRKWNADEDLDDADGRQTVVKEKNKTRAIGETGWRVDAGDYRPFLAHSELGHLITESPAQLHDALLAGLGLTDVEAARKRLVTARNQRKTLVTETDATAKELLGALQATAQQSSDTRIAGLAAAMNKKPRDLDAIASLVDLTSEVPEELTVLRDLTRLAAPEPNTIGDAATRLRDAERADRELTEHRAGQALRVARLLEQSLDLLQETKEGDCPVCGTPGVITDAWRDSATRQVQQLRVEAAEADRAKATLKQCVTDAQRLCAPVPPSVVRAGETGIEGLDVRELVATWTEWQQGSELTAPVALAAHLESMGSRLAELIGQCRTDAQALYEARQDVWRPLATQIQEWLPEARRARRLQAALPLLQRAAEWLRDTVDQLRNERFEPIAREAVANWELVRLHSSVNLREITAGGAGNQRTVSLDVEIDGKDANALGVMSQGELNSLALSLFLPRAALRESPFGFMVVDDPVQALDPSKVDGLARLLARAAETRQVVVLSHDDRLPEAIRRLGIEARFIDVSRRANSVIEFRKITGPMELLLEDARAVAKTPQVPGAMKDRLVGGFCRSAIEAACMQAIRARRIGRGEAHGDVETLLNELDRLRALVSVALFDKVDEAKVDARLTNALGRRAKDALEACNEGSHHAVDVDLLTLIRDAEELARYLRDVKIA